MSTGLPAALDALRRPEYTGENRCTPCTIALRGYLVPGTPWLTRTYLPDRVLRHFEHGEPAPAADVEPYAVLDAAGAVTECAEVDDLCLTDGFRAAWWDEIDALRGADAGREELGAMLELSPEEIDLETHGEAYVALVAGAGASGRWRIGQWESTGAFVADMAGARVLSERLEGWADLEPASRGRVLNGLRVFLDRCPSCGGDVRFGEETVQSCCRTREVAAVTCQDCGDRLFEAEQPDAG